jgi:hypothetical protein
VPAEDADAAEAEEPVDEVAESVARAD